jgi:hypothetical protein
MPQDKETITVKKMKAEMRKKTTKPVDNSVDNSIYKSSLVLPEVISSDNVGLSKNTVFNISNINLIIMNEHKMKVSEAVVKSKVELLLPAYKAEGIEPTDRLLAEGVMHMVLVEASMKAI